MCRLASRQRFDVELVKTSFQVPLWEALALVHSTDVFIGMHGAGFANLLGMHKVSRHDVRPGSEEVDESPDLAFARVLRWKEGT